MEKDTHKFLSLQAIFFINVVVNSDNAFLTGEILKVFLILPMKSLLHFL